MSGHSKWHNIQAKKGKTDAARGAGACGIEIDGARLYLFDAETRLTLLARDDGYRNAGFADADAVPLTFTEEEELLKTFKSKKADKKKK